jgi:peroxiredoxin
MKPTMFKALFIGIVGVTALSALACGRKESSNGAPPASGSLKPSMTFPSVDVFTVDGETVNTTSLIQGHDSIVIFVSLGCESCEELIGTWKSMIDQISDDLSVFALVQDEPEFAKQFVEEEDFPFPLYCEDKGIFARDYKIRVFPSVVGTTADGSVAFVGKAVTPSFTPAKAMDLLEKVKKAREEG